VNALSALAASFGLWDHHRPGDRARLCPAIRWPAWAAFGFAIIGIIVFSAIAIWLPDDTKGRRSGRGAAMSYPSLASPVTVASVVAATAPRREMLKWHDGRIRRWILAGVAAGHAQAATLTCIGFFVIDRLRIPAQGSEQPISIVMIAGAGAGLAAQWGLIPRLGLRPRALILWGSVIAAAGFIVTMLAPNLYGLVPRFALSSLGFGFTRPGFTAGASLAVPLGDQGGVAGVHHRRQWHQLCGGARNRHGALRRRPSFALCPVGAAAPGNGLLGSRPARLEILAVRHDLGRARLKHSGQDEADAAIGRTASDFNVRWISA
jgi:hypothetical protein